MKILQIAVSLSVLTASSPVMAAPWKTDIEAPPTLHNPVVAENVCPEDPGWPTAEQGAGRDILRLR